MSNPSSPTSAATRPNPNLVMVHGSGKSGKVIANLKSQNPEKSLQSAIDKVAPNPGDCGSIIATWNFREGLKSLVKAKVGNDILLGASSKLSSKGSAKDLVTTYGWTFCRKD